MQYTNKKRLAVQEFEITQELAENLYAECNRLFFNNDLPHIPIEIITDDDINGDFKYDVDFENGKLNNFRIQISNARKRTKAKYISTIVHEIIHYLVVSEITPATIDEAIWYYKDNNQDKFDELLYNNKYAHTGKWSTKADYINKVYGIKINRS